MFSFTHSMSWPLMAYGGRNQGITSPGTDVVCIGYSPSEGLMLHFRVHSYDYLLHEWPISDQITHGIDFRN